MYVENQRLIKWLKANRTDFSINNNIHSFIIIKVFSFSIFCQDSSVRYWPSTDNQIGSFFINIERHDVYEHYIIRQMLVKKVSVIHAADQGWEGFFKILNMYLTSVSDRNSSF